MKMKPMTVTRSSRKSFRVGSIVWWCGSDRGKVVEVSEKDRGGRSVSVQLDSGGIVRDTDPHNLTPNESLADCARLLRHCRFGPGTPTKAFVRQLNAALDRGADLDSSLSEKQQAYLRKLRFMYRKQIGVRSS